ncbi:hypothetical protein NXW52_23385 [Bacteroides ovatus]|nr:hypothetical protein NXW52_23385 [Bacteroides ovatus]
MAFTVKTQKAVSTDMVIVLSAKSETEGLDASQIVLSSSQVTLKEGQMTSGRNHCNGRSNDIRQYHGKNKFLFQCINQ